MDLEIKKEYFIIYTDWYSRQDFKTGQEYWWRSQPPVKSHIFTYLNFPFSFFAAAQEKLPIWFPNFTATADLQFSPRTSAPV
jgi:hypothetical protein